MNINLKTLLFIISGLGFSYIVSKAQTPDDNFEPTTYGKVSRKDFSLRDQIIGQSEEAGQTLSSAEVDTIITEMLPDAATGGSDKEPIDYNFSIDTTKMNTTIGFSFAKGAYGFLSNFADKASFGLFHDSLNELKSYIYGKIDKSKQDYLDQVARDKEQAMQDQVDQNLTDAMTEYGNQPGGDGSGHGETAGYGGGGSGVGGMEGGLGALGGAD